MTTSLLRQLDYLPEGLLTASPDELESLLEGPTLIHLQGNHAEPLFVSVLLHGNEPTGLLAIQSLLQRYKDKILPRSLSIFFGNVSAASKRARRLDEQADYNRIWPGTELAECPETKMASQIVEIMSEKQLFASIDIHNNTGLNPHYSCVNKLEPEFLQLATLFGRFVVYFIRPKGVQSSAFAQYCPAVTLECGRPGQQYGVEHALDFVNAALNLTEIPQHDVHAHDIDLFHTVAQVCVKDDIEFSFDDEQAELLLNSDIERLNFTEIARGTPFGKVTSNKGLPLIAMSETGENITERFFSNEQGYPPIKRPTMPSMLTLDEKVIRQDCLCYLMERLAI